MANFAPTRAKASVCVVLLLAGVPPLLEPPFALRNFFLALAHIVSTPTGALVGQIPGTRYLDKGFLNPIGLFLSDAATAVLIYVLWSIVQGVRGRRARRAEERSLGGIAP